jgi:hypothetical protein
MKTAIKCLDTLKLTSTIGTVHSTFVRKSDADVAFDLKGMIVKC